MHDLGRIPSKMKKIALVNPPYPGKDRTYMLGLGYISAVLNASGIETLILDEPCAGFTAGAEALSSLRVSQNPVS
ncbi:MAG TPA: hypothetical protein PLQ76_02420, partial [bacterium]|nr:hypothetical protein [bacterium]